MNNLDKTYQALLQDILDNGVEKTDRTGTGTISVFGRQIRHKMSEGYPLLTTKKMAFKTMVTELLWFLKGDTNIKYLVDNGCRIWDGDAYKQYKSTNPDYLTDDEMFKTERGTYKFFTQEEFINKIKTDDEFAKKWGELGPIYGAQWRSWRVGKGVETSLPHPDGGNVYESFSMYIDQIENLINDLKTNPDSRRLMVNAWNVGELDEMTLPPCHFSWQCYSHEKEGKRYLSLAWNQRSVDMGLGLPFNIASYGLLLEMIAKEVDMIPDELIGNLGDCHIYSNHIKGVKEQITRKPMPLPTIEIKELDLLKGNLQVELKNYLHHDPIKLPLSN
jgi:thymidylate synthase